MHPLLLQNLYSCIVEVANTFPITARQIKFENFYKIPFSKTYVNRWFKTFRATPEHSDQMNLCAVIDLQTFDTTNNLYMSLT